ncbi:MAG: PPC domain-containing DNA-binding protein [candidate division Zixibacteria bacterium]
MESRKVSDGYIIRCDIGEEIVSVLTDFAEEKGIYSGTVTGIGALKTISLGYVDIPNKDYIRKEFDDMYELLNLTGNFSRFEGKVMLHCHAVFSDVNFQVYGGHLFNGVVAVTAEFYIRPGDLEINRVYDDATGIKKIEF